MITAYTGKFLNVKIRNNWEFAERKNITGIVGIIAITDDEKLVLIEQYREPVQKTCLEIPAGLVENETLLAGAKRELLEETGYRAHNLEIIGHFPLTPGMTNEIMTTVIATNLEKINEGGGDENEDIKVIEIPLTSTFENIMKFESSEKLIDSKVFLALYIGKQYLAKQFVKEL